ncbi:MAG TPA: dual specificity protein phosphatase family protein [Terriglobales bacterium]|nr:dual specificity protein phosphatase family protein [Terriglobales bacterium]
MNWIAGLGPARLATMPRPRGGDWLKEEIEQLRVEGVDVLVSALTPDEVDELGLVQEPDTCRENGISFLAFPIADRDVPDSYGAVRSFVEGLNKELCDSKAVAIHCRAGIGRSSLLAACTLVVAGLSVDQAFAAIREARGCNVPDTEVQRVWVEKFAQRVQGARVE